MPTSRSAAAWEPSEIARVLSHSRLFYGLPPASLFDLIAHSQVEIVETGTQPVIPANELRVILEGDLEIMGTGAVLGRGNFYGESVLLDLALAQEINEVRIRSHDGCVCLVTSSPDITGWLERHPLLQATVFQHLAQELFNRCA